VNQIIEYLKKLYAMGDNSYVRSNNISFGVRSWRSR